MTTLTRPQYERACWNLIQKHTSCTADQRTLTALKNNWSWKDHPSFPGLGYLHRSVFIPVRLDTNSQDGEEDILDDAVESPDPASASTDLVQLATTVLYVAYSASFQVPALYFSVHHDNGTPLSLAEICRLPLFRPQALSGTQVASFAVQDPTSAIALLSQGDHPTLGVPCWYIHPCNTSAVVGEIMAEVNDLTWTDEERSLRWMEAWFMVLGNMVSFDF